MRKKVEERKRPVVEGREAVIMGERGGRWEVSGPWKDAVEEGL